MTPSQQEVDDLCFSYERACAELRAAEQAARDTERRRQEAITATVARIRAAQERQDKQGKILIGTLVTLALLAAMFFLTQ